MLRTGFLLVLAACLVLCASMAQAEDIKGTVTDPSGAVMPGAVVRISNHESGAEISVTSGREGEFRATGLHPGTYDVFVNCPGFAPFSREQVALKRGELLEVHAVLKLASVSMQTTVTAKAPLGEGALETSPTNALEVLEVREVRESPAKDVGEALANLDGVWKVRKGPIANDVVVRGFQRGNLDVLLDGMRVYEACPSQMDPTAYHMEFAELDSADVVKGPFEYRYEGSLGGTVKILGKDPSETLSLTPNLTTGSFNFYNPSFVASGSKGPVHALAGYAWRRSEPYETGEGKRVTQYANFTAAGAAKDAFESHAGWARASFDISPRQSIEFLGGHQADGLTVYPGLLMDAIYDTTDRLGANWSLRQLNGPVKTLRARVYLTSVKQWMTDELRTSAMGASLGYSMGTMSGTRALGGRFEAELSNLILGAEVYDRGWSVYTQKLQGGTYVTVPAIPDIRMIVGGFYGQYGRSFGKLYLTLAGRLDRASTEATITNLNFDQRMYWAYHSTRAVSADDLNGSGYVRLTYMLPRGFELYAGFGSSTRLPDPEERYYANQRIVGDWVGNPLLRSSRNNEIDVGLNWRNSRFALRPTLFFGRLSDFIATYDQLKQNMTPGVMAKLARSYANVDAQVSGGELSYAVQFSRSLLLSGGFSYIRGLQFANPQAGIPGGNLAEIPPLKSRAALRYGRELFFVELNGLAAARQDKVSTYLKETPTAGYAILGFKTGIHHKQMNLSFGVDNLANRFYYEHLSFVRDPYRIGVRVPEPGRTFYVNISVNLANALERSKIQD